MLVEDNPADARLVRELLTEASAVGFEMAHVDRLVEAIERLKAETFDIILLDLRLPDSAGLETFTRIRDQAPDTPIVVLTGLADDELGTSAVTEGAQDYLVKGQVDGASLARSIRYAVARHATQAEPTQRVEPTERGQALGFVGAKGGVGTTTVVLNIAAAIAKLKKSVIVLELRPDYGTFSAQLGHTPLQNLSYVAKLEPERITEKELSACLMHLPYDIRVLFGPQDPGEFGDIGREQAAAAIEGLATMADCLLVDLCCHSSATAQEAVRHFDQLVIVTTPEPACLTASRIAMEALKSWGVRKDRISELVVNITGLFASVSLREIRADLDCDIVGILPSSGDDFLAAHRHGVPLVVHHPHSPAAVSLTEIAKRLSGEAITRAIM
jgi:Flp pilus assembly CpaE family ATPase